MKYSKLAILFFLAIILISSCGKKEETKEQKQQIPPTNTTNIESIFVSSPPPNPKNISEVKAIVKPGEKITIKGEIGGRKSESFNPNFAIFFLADPSILTNCNKKEHDSCPTPWDYCCEPKDKLRSGIALIQLKSNNTGEVFNFSLKGYNGLKELSSIIVEGVVSENSNPETLIIDAEKIYLIN